MKRRFTIAFFGLAIATFACREAYDVGYNDGQRSLRDFYQVKTEETEVPNRHLVEGILRQEIEELEKELTKCQAIIASHALEPFATGE